MSARSPRRIAAEQPGAGRIEADDAPVAVDLEDEVGRAIDDGAQLLAFLLERLAQACPRERDRQLVAREQGDAHAVLVEDRVRPRPDQDGGRRRPSSRITARASATVAGPGTQGIDVVRTFAARLASARRRAAPRAARPLVRAAVPQRAAGAIGQADELAQDGLRQAGERPARGDELAQLVLGEERIGLPLGVIERAPPLAFEGVDARQEPVRVGARRSAATERPQQEEARDGARVQVPDRALAEAQRQAAPRDERPGGAHAAGGRPDPRLPMPARRPKASAAGRSASRIVLSPTAHRPRRASPSAAATSIVLLRRADRASPRRRPGPRPRGRPCRTADPTRRRRPRRGDGRRPATAPRAACPPAARRASHRPPGSR